MRRILFALVALAGLSLPAFAQSFDETVSYIQDRCVGQTVEYGEARQSTGGVRRSSTLLAFNAEEGGSIEFRRTGTTGTIRSDHRVSLSDVVSVEHTGQNKIVIRARPDSSQSDWLDDDRGAYPGSGIDFYCPTPDRIVRALQHLVSFAGDDPFAN